MDCVTDKAYINSLKKWILLQYMGLSVFVWRLTEAGGISYVSLVVEGHTAGVQVQALLAVHRLIQRPPDRPSDPLRHTGVQ